MPSNESNPTDAPPDLTPSQVDRLRAGDAAAGRLLEALYRDPLIRFCRAYVSSFEDAEDAVQEIFCKILAASQAPTNFRAWIYRVARNHCLNLLRNRKRRKDRRPLDTGAQIDAELTGQLTRLVRRELGGRAHEILEALPENNKEVLRLRYAVGLSRGEIADILGVKESIVKSRLFEGLKKIRQHLPPLEESP